jgi:hypothetical protein
MKMRRVQNLVSANPGAKPPRQAVAPVLFFISI